MARRRSTAVWRFANTHFVGRNAKVSQYERVRISNTTPKNLCTTPYVFAEPPHQSLFRFRTHHTANGSQVLIPHVHIVHSTEVEVQRTSPTQQNSSQYPLNRVRPGPTESITSTTDNTTGSTQHSSHIEAGTESSGDTHSSEGQCSPTS